MRDRRLLLLLLLPLAALPSSALAGCTSDPAPAPSRSAPAPSSAAPDRDEPEREEPEQDEPEQDEPVRTAGPIVAPATVGPVAVPPRLPGEIARGTWSAGGHRGVLGPVSARTRTVYLHAACSGPAGTRMRYRLLDGRAEPFGPAGDIACTGGRATAETVADSFPQAAQVDLHVDPGVTVAYAVLTTSVEE